MLKKFDSIIAKLINSFAIIVPRVKYYKSRGRYNHTSTPNQTLFLYNTNNNKLNMLVEEHHIHNIEASITQCFSIIQYVTPYNNRCVFNLTYVVVSFPYNCSPSFTIFHHKQNAHAFNLTCKGSAITSHHRRSNFAIIEMTNEDNTSTIHEMRSPRANSNLPYQLCTTQGGKQNGY